MHVPITTATLALLTLAIFVLRIFWLRVPEAARFFLIRAAVALVILHVLSSATQWGTSSDRVNVLIKWGGIVSYELLLMFFSRMSPRWLTSVCALILLVPVFASSIIMPLTHIFDSNTYKVASIDNDLAYQKVPWGEDASANTGVDLLIYHRPRFAPFLRHLQMSIPFNNRQCNAGATFVIPGPDPKTVLARCPQWPSQGPGTVDRLLHLR
jgi:hypothetical protein